MTFECILEDCENVAEANELCQKHRDDFQQAVYNLVYSPSRGLTYRYEVEDGVVWRHETHEVDERDNDE